MKLFILGATGGTGRALVGQALARGHAVTALVRSPEKMTQRDPRLTILPGNPCNAAELTAALPGHDAVVSALGPPGTGRTTILRECAHSTVTAMQAAGVRRLLVVSAAVLFQNAGILVAVMRRTLLRHVAQDATEMERVIAASNLDWTIVRPPRLTNGPLSGRYQSADGYLPGGGLIISRADVAHFILNTVEANSHLGQVVGVSR